MAKARLDDYHWLISDAAARWLDDAADDPAGLVSKAVRLRKALGAERAHLVLEQVELRARGLAKFERSPRMFFTRQGLEQATDQHVSAYKARRLAAGEPVADLCCGIGGDLIALAGRGPVVGVDRDPVIGLLAKANLEASTSCDSGRLESTVQIADVAETPVEQFAAWHIDPDRRAIGRRTTRPELHEPGLPVLVRLLEANGNAAIKLAPAADVPDDWPRSAELEWIGRDRQCRQLVAWFGSLALSPGRRRATVLAEHGDGDTQIRTLVGDVVRAGPVASQIERYVFDPHPAVLAAGLTAALAAEHGLVAVCSGEGYLTGASDPADPALAAFEVSDVLHFDMKRLRGLIRDRNIGQLEIKKRGVSIRPEDVRRQLRPKGPNQAVLLLAPVAGRVTAILAKRRHI